MITQTYKICDNLVGMSELKDKSIDLTITSPPYDELRTYNGHSSFNFEKTAKELYRITKDGGVIVWVVGDQIINESETGNSFKQALYFKEIGFNIHDTMIYLKENIPFPSSNRYYQAFEYMFIFSKGKPKTTNLIKDKVNKSYGRNLKGTSYRLKDGTTRPISNENKTIPQFSVRYNYWLLHNASRGVEIKHPAIFPEELAKDHIISWSNEGDTILDPFCGSGTTLKMCKILNRNGIGFEINPEYEKIIKERLNTIESKEEIEKKSLFNF